MRLVWMAAMLTSMLLAPFVAASSASAAKLAGFGDPVARFQVAFPRDNVGCDASSCYGPHVSASSSPFEFSYITTAKGRVDGFDLALTRGTSYLKAELEIAQLFPNDIQMGSFQVIHHDSDGNACAVYDLQSKTLAKIFGKKAFGNSNGTVGVELARALPNGNTIYVPDNVDLALIVPTYLGSDADC
jgi:hypothetical protein